MLVLLVLEADIARIDAVFRQRFGAGRMIGQKLVADIMEIADKRHIKPKPQQPLADFRHGGRTLVAVDGDAHDFRTGPEQRRHLLHGGVDIRRIGVGHRLHDDGRAATDDDTAHVYGDGCAAGLGIVIGM